MQNLLGSAWNDNPVAKYIHEHLNGRELVVHMPEVIRSCYLIVHFYQELHLEFNKIN